MRAGIYCEHSLYDQRLDNSPVGHLMALLAERCLNHGYSVTLYAASPGLFQAIRANGAADLPRCKFAVRKPFSASIASPVSLVSERAYRFLRGRVDLNFAHSLDLLIYLTGAIPPACPANRGILMAGCPDLEEALQLDTDAGPLRAADREKLRRLRTWDVVVSPLHCTSAALAEQWLADAVTVLPPVTPAASALRQDVILLPVPASPDASEKRSIGQAVEAYRRLNRRLGGTWRLRILEEGASRPAEPSEGASFCWAAAGPPSPYPAADHVLRTVVRAMSAGAVPAVHGGSALLSEVVQGGNSGLLWRSPEDLVRRTIALVNSPDLLDRYRLQAITRSSDFSVANFRQAMDRIISALRREQAA